MTGPRSVGGRKRQGWRGEAAVKAYYLGQGLRVFDLSPNLTGADLLVARRSGYIYEVAVVVEVKTTPWRDLPSPVRQSAARAGDAYREAGFFHLLWCPDGARGEWETRTVGVSQGRASTLNGPSQTGVPFAVARRPQPPGPPPTGPEGAAVSRGGEGP